MFEYIFLKIKTNKSHLLFFTAIIATGIFLRAYNFHDWLRFSLDQSRDAMIISDAVEGKSELPFLGPLAGGTNFHLGPAYYYFSFLTAKFLGNYPDKMAYPSLIFSIAAIPLLYFFLKEYFSMRISLILSAIMSVSYFAVINSRFSSNPNLVPFFVLLFLFSFLKLTAEQKEKHRWWFSVLVGLSLGIGIQLHTTLLVTMPICALIFFIYLLKTRGRIFLKYGLASFLIFLTVNVTQIVSEISTSGNNTQQFFDGLENKNISKNDWSKSGYLILMCQFKSNIHIISSLPETENCSRGIDFNIKTGSKELYQGIIKNRTLSKTAYALNIFFISIFSLTGYILAIYYFRKEENEKNKLFLGSVFIFNIVGLVFLTGVANYLYINYFIILFFIPFIFLGLWLKFLEEKFPSRGKQIGALITVILIIFSLWADKNAAKLHAEGLNNNLENTDLRKIEAVSGFILKNTKEEFVYLTGEKKYLERFYRPISYMLSRQGIGSIELDIDQAIKMIPENQEFIYIKNSDSGNAKKSIYGYNTITSEQFDPISIYILKNP
jgi:4-amino-4-deoxy-L-arabinose transferase-like glycosyltransferase